MRRREFITSIFILPFGLNIHSIENKREKEHHIISRRNRRTLFALGEAYFPEHIKEQTKDDFLEKAETYLMSYNNDMRKGYAFMLMFLEFLPLLSLYSYRTFSRMRLEHRREFLERLSKSRFQVLRTILFALKSIPCLYHFSSPEVKSSLGIKYKV